MPVYLITSAEPPMVKIGFTRGLPRNRFITVKGSSPVPLILRAVIKGDEHSEWALKQRFAAYHSHNEWFRLEGPLAEFVASLPLSGITIKVQRPKSGPDIRPQWPIPEAFKYTAA